MVSIRLTMAELDAAVRILHSLASEYADDPMMLSYYIPFRDGLGRLIRLEGRLRKVMEPDR